MQFHRGVEDAMGGRGVAGEGQRGEETSWLQEEGEIRVESC